MKVVLKHKDCPAYVKTTGPNPGNWMAVSNIEDATVFALDLDPHALGGLKVDPPVPFDTRGDYRDRDRIEHYYLVPVRTRVVEEL